MSVRGIRLGVVRSFLFGFRIFIISLISLKGSQLTVLKTGANGAFILKKEGQNHKVQKVRVKSQLDFTVGARSPISHKQNK